VEALPEKTRVSMQQQHAATAAIGGNVLFGILE
jgi:hypothetical protein